MRVGNDVRRLNPEKVAFALASAWLLVTALSYLDAPELTRWGPARTGAVDTDVPRVSLDFPRPLDLRGRDVFRDEDIEEPAISDDAAVIDDDPDEPDVEPPEGDLFVVGEIVVAGPDEDGGTPAVSEPDVAFRGSMEVEHKGRWFVFEHASTGHYHSARKGEAMGELGLRVVEVRDRTPVVEYTPPRED